MNTCNIIGQVIKKPELRYTPDNQLAVTDLIIEFDRPLGYKQGDVSKSKIEVVGWGNLASEISDTYKVGDYVIVEGRLEMNTIERDGYKDKRARIVASRIHMSSKPVEETYSSHQTPPQTPPLAQSTKSKAKAKDNHSNFDNEDNNIPF